MTIHLVPTAPVQKRQRSADRVPVEIVDEDLYDVTIDVPVGLTHPECRAYRGRGIEGVQRAMAQIIRDGARKGRYDLHLGIDSFIVDRLEELNHELSGADAELADSLKRRIKSLTFLLDIGKVIDDIAEAVDAGTFDPNAQVPDAVVQHGGALSEGSPKTYGAFVEEFLYEMAKGSGGRLFDWNVPFAVVRID